MKRTAACSSGSRREQREKITVSEGLVVMFVEEMARRFDGRGSDASVDADRADA
jgi:hypothetical protein